MSHKGADEPVGTKTAAVIQKKRYPPHESGRYRWQIDYAVWIFAYILILAPISVLLWEKEKKIKHHL